MENVIWSEYQLTHLLFCIVNVTDLIAAAAAVVVAVGFVDDPAKVDRERNGWDRART